MLRLFTDRFLESDSPLSVTSHKASHGWYIVSRSAVEIRRLKKFVPLILT